VDRALARRLERAEASANAAFVEARAAIDAAAGAAWTEIAGAYAMFDGVGSPLTQAFGVGLFASFLEPEFERVEAFFTARGAATAIEVCELAEARTRAMLPVRGYAPIEHSTVLIRATSDARPLEPGAITVRASGADESDAWARVAADGWRSEGEDLAHFVEALGRVTARARGMQCFVAEERGSPVAAGALYLVDDVALLAGASTIPSARGRGAQRALLQARLAYAAARGIALAMIVTQPASGSQRNAERQGFTPVYGRSKWERPRPA
jgi:GNAT superfamily N-acetyltransferase